MPYTIPYSDEANNGTITVVDNTVDQTTSLKFPGRNSTSYGTAIAENFLHLLENFASATQPNRPTEGQMWYDTTPGAEQLKVYDGTVWIPSGGLNRAPTAPDVAFSQSGDLWVDTDNQQLYLNSGSGWVLVGPTFSDGLATGASPLTVTGTDNEQHTVVQVEVNAQPVALIATDSFTPKSVIPGFTVINPGINLANKDITGDGAPKFYGTAEKAENLIVNNISVAAGNFLRGDVTSTTLFPVNVQNNTGLVIGTDAAINIGVEGQAGIIRHQIEGSNIDLQVKNSGSTKTVLRVDSNLRVGINNEAPDEALDVTGNIQTDSNLFVNGTTQSTTIGTGSVIVKGGVGIAKNVNVGGAAQVLGVTTLANTIPDGNNTRNLGSATSKWQNMYATTFIGNLTGNVNGTVSGIAGSANKLTSASTFRITGDIVADDVTFDGQTGGSLKTFTTRIGNAIISARDATTSTQIDDEMIINRVSGSTGLYKTSRKTLLSAVPINPAGVLMPYAGTSIPRDWLLCDGGQYRISEYSSLFDAIGYNFGARVSLPSGFFKVPDMRGRTPLGADNMGGTSANVVNADYAQSIGQIGGSEFEVIDTTNLPEHKHDLRAGDTKTGPQFYAVQRDSDETPEGSIYFGLNPADSATSAYGLPNSGGLLVDPDTDVGQPLNVMNPTMTFNYIIYTGRAIS
jgi:microcystin-dependent protein